MAETPKLSYTALTTYEKCPERFRREKVEKESGINLPKDYFLIGRLAHKIVEHILTGQDKETAYQKALPEFLENLGFSKEALDDGLYNQIRRYGWEYGSLLHRAAPCYHNAADRIRKKDGTVLSDPHNYPNKDLREEYEGNDLDVDKHDIDTVIGRRYQYYTFISLADCVALGTAYAMNFEHPDWVERTESVELDCSAVEKLGSEEWRFAAYADWVVRVDPTQLDLDWEAPENPLAMLDFKSGKKPPTHTEVMWNPQLNFYCLFYYANFGEMPKYVGIYHLPTGKPYLAELSQTIMDRIVDHYGAVADNIAAKQFPKRFPTQFNSPCVERSFKTQQVTGICPFLPDCWPEFYEDLSDEPLVQSINQVLNE